MKIAVASALGWPYVRRGNRFTYELSAYLARRGHDVCYITSKPGIRGRVKEKDGIFIEYHRLMSTPLLSVVGAQNLDTFILPSLNSLLKNDFDIVQTVLPMDAFAASVTKKLRGTPFVHYMIDSFRPYYYITKYGKFMLKKGIQSAVRVTAPSRFIVDDVKKNFGIDALLTPPPVDTDQFILCDNKELDCPKILYTSSIHDPRKGFLMLVKAFEKLLDYVPGAQLQLSGHVHPKAIEVIFKSVGARTGKAIKILGVGRREDLPDLYRNATVTVLPSLNEAFGMVLLESLASGTPIVGIKSGGIPDIFVNDEVGILAEPDGGPEELCSAILRGFELAHDSGVWKKCREHAESFSWSTLGPRFEKLYEQIADTSNRKRVRTFTKNSKTLEPALDKTTLQAQTNETDFKRMFDDALDEIEIDYDNYYRVDRYRPLCIFVAGWLHDNGLRKGNVLVVGCFTFPLDMFLKKCGFTVRGIEITQRHESWNDIGNQTIISDIRALKDEPGYYDIIICDDILQYCEFPVRTFQILRDKLNSEGILICATENAVNGNSRLRLLMGKNIYPSLNSDVPGENWSTEVEKGIVRYRGYTLEEAKQLAAEAGLYVNQGSYMIKEKAVEASLFPIPFLLYFYKKLYYLVQKAFPPLRSHVFVAARKNLNYFS
jgi:phosphatidylinositol alpha-mannosyltransferase